VVSEYSRLEPGLPRNRPVFHGDGFPWSASGGHIFRKSGSCLETFPHWVSLRAVLTCEKRSVGRRSLNVAIPWLCIYTVLRFKLMSALIFWVWASVTTAWCMRKAHHLNVEQFEGVLGQKTFLLQETPDIWHCLRKTCSWPVGVFSEQVDRRSFLVNVNRELN